MSVHGKSRLIGREFKEWIDALHSNPLGIEQTVCSCQPALCEYK